MEKEEMIKAIYEKIADKTLSKGCIIDVLDTEGGALGIAKIEHIERDGGYVYMNINEGRIGDYYCDEMDDKLNIIGHPVMIGDILDYFNVDDWYDLIDIETDTDDTSIYNSSKYSKIIELYKLKRKPIEEQSEECIEYVYNLIK